MKDCRKCGEAFEPRTKYSFVCDNCKYKNTINIKNTLKGKNISTPYFLREKEQTETFK